MKNKNDIRKVNGYHLDSPPLSLREKNEKAIYDEKVLEMGKEIDLAMEGLDVPQLKLVVDSEKKDEINREMVDIYKLRHFLSIFLGKTRESDVYLNKFSDFNISLIQKLTSKEIKHLLLDVDGCIAPAYGDIIPENIEHIKKLKAEGVDIGIYSNCKYMPRLDVLTDINVPIYKGDYAKPNPKGFLEACEQFGFKSENTWMIGENPMTDGGAVGVLGGVGFVKPVPDKFEGLPPYKVVGLLIQKVLRKIALVCTLGRNKNIIKL